MSIPWQVTKLENSLKLRSAIYSVSELSQFPFSSYADFLQAVEQDKIFFQLRRDYYLLWRVCNFPDKLVYSAFAHIGFIVAIGLGLRAFITHDYWLLLSIPIFVLSNICAVPNPGCFHGFFPAVAGVIGFCLGSAFHPSLALTSLLWMFPWIIASFGSAVAAEVTIESLKHSELILIWAVHNGIVSVEFRD